MEKTAKEIAALRFIKTGEKSSFPEFELATECDNLIQQESHKSLKKALTLARSFASQSAKASSELRLAAFRALARMTHMSGRHSEALQAYLEARKLARQFPQIRARIDRALIDVYMYLGDFIRARRSAQAAIIVFRALKSESDLAQTRVNYANMLHRQDRHREAERLYQGASEFFEQAGNQLALARCQYNHANTLVQLFEIDEAERLYKYAEKIYKEAGYQLEANDASYGLAWLRMLTGKFHHALLELSDCEKAYRVGGDPRGEALCILDRAEVYIALGLYDDALAAARMAEKRFTKLKLAYESSKASLFRGQAAAALGRLDEAGAANKRAESGFSGANNRGFMGVVHLLSADLAAENTKVRNYEIRVARSLFSRAQLPLWQAVCDLKLANENRNSGSAFKRLSQSGAAHHVPTLYIAWQTAYGDYKYRTGEFRAARHHWRLAADRLDTVRAQLPPLELRSAYARSAASPHLRLIASEIENNPKMAAVWVERYKTAGIWAPISSGIPDDFARLEIESGLAALAQQVSILARQVESTAGERSISVSAKNAALRKLEREFREKLMILEKDSVDYSDSNDRLLSCMIEASRKMPIIHFHMQGDGIMAFVISRGAISVHRFKEGRTRLRQSLQRWNFIFESEILADYLTGMSGGETEESIWRNLGEWLWKPLNISHDCKQVLIIPEGELGNLPFEAIIVNDKPLIEKYHFIYSPSFRHYLAADKIKVESEEKFLFKGNASDLSHASSELNQIIANSDDRMRVFNPSHRADWPASGEAKLWHYSGHAVFRADNPFYSYLALQDGPLFAADFRLKNCRVDLVTLAACRSGEQVVMPGEEATGLVRSLLEMGTRNVIASHWPVSDRTTALWMNEFYNKYFFGDNIYDAARHASLMVRERYRSAYHWAAFSISGAGA